MEINNEVLLPREKALKFGVDSLNDKELLAILIGSGGKENSVFDIADSLLKTYGSLSLLSRVNLRDLLSQKGIKETKCLQLLVAFEINRRLNRPEYKNEEILDDINKIYTHFSYLESYDQEVLTLAMLNKKKRIIKEKVMYQGTRDGFNIDIKEIISELLISKCSFFILIHNHVEEENKASYDDIVSTRLLRHEALQLRIVLIDHLIIYKNGYFSFKDNDLF